MKTRDQLEAEREAAESELEQAIQEHETIKRTLSGMDSRLADHFADMSAGIREMSVQWGETESKGRYAAAKKAMAMASNWLERASAELRSIQ